ncbi:MAG: hypothetical protein H7177_18045 [Rhizobacter sp.]|nr:hypothetical protein [Bacteriovorax sp.]
MKAFLVLGLLVATTNTVFANVYKSLDATPATYEVPVSEELKEYAVFELSDLEKKIKGDRFVVEYSLPDVLTGNIEYIHLEGKIQANKDEVVMIGDKGAARCKGVYTETTCTVQYNGLEIDADKATEAIKNISKSDKETFGRIEVMRAFSTDPVGIIVY